MRLPRHLLLFLLGFRVLCAEALAFVSADALDSQSVVVMWADAHADETAYRIERALHPSGPFSQVHEAAADTDVWTDSGLSAATTYHYRVVPVLPSGPAAALGPAAATTLASGDSTARMRQNALNYWRAVGASRKSPRMVQALATVDSAAHSAFSAQQANGSWTDITYTDLAPAASWGMAIHYERLRDMARAWATPGAALYQNTALRDGFLLGVDYIETRVNTTTSLAGGNWWWWQIGAPERYGPALVLMREQLGPARLAATAATLNYLVGDAPRQGVDGIQNHVWVGTNRLYHGMLAGDAASIQAGATRLADQVAFAQAGGEGIMPDFSFQAHGTTVSGQWLSQLATGHYGASYLAYIPRFTFFAEGTSFQLTPAKQSILADFALHGARWSVWGHHKDISSEGRIYTRAASNSGEIMSGLLALANTPGSPAAATAGATTKALLQNWTRPLLPEDAGFAARVEAAAVTAALPAGLVLYPYSDYAVFRAAGSFVSVKTASTRSLIGELVNNENKRGRHLASGVTWIMTGDEYRASPVIPTLDHARLPGTTVENGVSLTASSTWHYLPGRRAFVGGAGDGTGGVVAQDFLSRAASSDSNLVAKKSWFFFNDSFVALGSGITSTVSRTVETTINQRPLPALAADITVNGSLLFTAATNSTTLSATSWIHAADIGYVFPAPATVRVKRQNQTGKWSDLGSGDSATTHTTPMFTLWFDHGNHVTTPAAANASYAYAVLPGRTAAQTQAVSAAAPYQVLAHTDALHAVRHATENAGGAVFWQSGAVDKISVNQPSVVHWRRSGDQVRLTLADPSHATRTITLVYAAPLAPVALPDGVAPSISGGSTTITFAVTAGRSYTADFTVLPPDSPPLATTLMVSPAAPDIAPGASVQFSAVVRDQYGDLLTPQPGFGWSVSGGGTISPSGLYTASATPGGPYVVTATAAGLSNTAAVTITAPPTESGLIPGPFYSISGGTLNATDVETIGANFIAGSSTAYDGVVSQFGPAVTLSEIGDTLTLSFVLESLASNNNQTWSFRYGLFNRNGQTVTAHNQPGLSSQWTGAFVVRHTSAGATSNENGGTTDFTANSLFRQAAGTANVIAEGIGGGFGAFPAVNGVTQLIARANGDNAPGGNDGTDGDLSNTELPLALTLTLERVATGLKITATPRFGGTATGEFTFTDTAPATYTFDALAIGSIGNFRVDSVTVTTNVAAEPPLTPFEHWQETAFLEGTPDADRLPDADPDGDGLNNLLEYALNTDPQSSGSFQLPSVQVSGFSLQISFLRARAELTYEVLASSTLAPDSWQVIATNPGTVSLTEPVTVTDTEPVSTFPRRFLRLRVTSG